ncbi:cytosine permease [Nissabacter sp. SGAir0207]|uniref:purine-cytosine permease family protein n=1 Tax=Nissabacter sp. SGAir0207 TaxID=2126321 RepID=UPI0010CCC167|nr:cytosine permease [Nissabacter sp. SGAir0207]QCR38850.1 cytosine permease [Nissabacter sp. SGAir0207]
MSTFTSAEQQGKTKRITESRSIDYIPLRERHGHPFSLFTLWFGGNLQITAIVTGALAVVLGGDVFWSLVGLFIGQILGAAVMALHAIQGPRFGLPQMIMSRAQFGVYGAVIPLVLACIMYVGFSAGGTVLAGQAMAKILGVSHPAGMIIFSAIIVVIAVLGYRVIHRLGKVATLIGLLTFAYLFVSILTPENLALINGNRHFSLPMFLLAISLSSSWQIAYCPYVSDYSRYLPKDVPAGKTFAAVFFGTVLGTQASMTLGVIAAALAGPAFSGNEVGYIVGLGDNALMALVIYAAICFGKITFTTLNAYGSFMSLATIVTGFQRRATLSPRVRIGFVVLMVALSCVIGLFSEPNFIKAFTHFLLFLLAFFVPWSAINLADFYLVSKGKMDVPALYDPAGRYGKWNLTGIAVYAAGVVVQLPFIENPMFHGSLTWVFAGNDISWLIGWVVTAALYAWVGTYRRQHVLLSSAFPE